MSFDNDENVDGNGNGSGSDADGNSDGASENRDDGLGAVDARVDGPDAVERVRQDEKARAMLKVLEEKRDEEGVGRVGTSEFRERTGMSSRGVHYRYDKLTDAGFVEIEYDAGATPEGVAPMKIAVLTERGEEAISRGLSGDTEDVTEDTVEDRVDAVSGEVRENRDALRDIYQWMQTTDERLDELEERVDALIAAVQEEHDAAGSVAERDDVNQGSDVGAVDEDGTDDSVGAGDDEEEGFDWQS